MSSKIKRNIIVALQVIIEPDEVGFHAYCPALKGLHTSGDTEEEALANARDVAIAYLDSIIKHGDPIPVGVILSEVERSLCPPQKGVTQHIEELAVAAR